MLFGNNANTCFHFFIYSKSNSRFRKGNVAKEYEQVHPFILLLCSFIKTSLPADAFASCKGRLVYFNE